MQRLEKRLGKERILYMDEAGMLAGDVYRWGWSEKGKYEQRADKNFYCRSEQAKTIRRDTGI